MSQKRLPPKRESVNFVCLLCGCAVVSTYFLVDHKKPNISVKGTPTLACNISFDDLMTFAEASDNKGLKSFFIEERSLSSIADSKHLTYVAIDENNNVSKQRVSVDVDPSVNTYHIEILKHPIKKAIAKNINPAFRL